MASQKNGVVYCFLDTNTLVHFATLDEVDWPKVVGARRVCLVLAPIVLHELDLHKDDHSNEWRRKRARTLVGKLKDLADRMASGEPTQVRRDTDLVFLAAEPRVDWQARALDPDRNDDRLLASILEFCGAYDARNVMLVTADVLLRLKAKGRGIEVFDPEGKVKRLQPKSESERLRRELEAVKSARPMLKLELEDVTDEATKRALPRTVPVSDALSDGEIAKEIDAQSQKLERMLCRGERKASREQLRKFKRDWEEYLSELEMARKMQQAFHYGMSRRLAFKLSNDGSAPAKGVEVTLQFPAGTFLFDAAADGVETEPLVPPEPIAAWDPRSALYVHYEPPRTAVSLIPKDRGPLYEFFDRSTVSYEILKLRHRDSWVLPPLVVYFPPSTRQGVAIAYSVQADNTDRIDGELTLGLAP